MNGFYLFYFHRVLLDRILWCFILDDFGFFLIVHHPIFCFSTAFNMSKIQQNKKNHAKKNAKEWERKIHYKQ